MSTKEIKGHCLIIHLSIFQTESVTQWARAFASQVEGWVFEIPVATDLRHKNR